MIDNLQLIARGVSLGDADSLISHPASLNRARQKAGKASFMVDGVDDDLIRLSVGLEDPEDICGDLKRALTGL